MKKIFLFICCFITIFCFANKKDLYGVWENGNVNIEIDSINIIISDNIEGDEWEWEIFKDTVKCENILGDKMSFKIISLDKNELSIKYDNDTIIYNFIKKN